MVFIDEFDPGRDAAVFLVTASGQTIYLTGRKGDDLVEQRWLGLGLQKGLNPILVQGLSYQRLESLNLLLGYLLLKKFASFSRVETDHQAAGGRRIVETDDGLHGDLAKWD